MKKTTRQEMRHNILNRFKPFVDKKVRIQATVKIGENYYGVEKTKDKEWVGYIRQADYLNGELPVFMQSNARKSFYTLAHEKSHVWDGHIFVKKIKEINK